MAPWDKILLDRFGVEQGRIDAKGDNEYYLAVNSGGDYTWKGKKYSGQAIKVNSKETVIGDKKEENPWDGNMVSLGDDHYRSLVSSRTDEVEDGIDDYSSATMSLNPSSYAGVYASGVLKAVERESQEGKKLDFVSEFKNGTIYKIDGVYYNSHEGLNYLWGSALDKLGIPSIVAVGAAMLYHKSAYNRDVKSGEINKYQRIGPINEPNHNKAIRAGYRLFK
ncbi:hypothetical protein [Sphingobacterium sp. LRF_L2]|uniref:hypothetical protein n=1 Tax=Sphingobacterium sp. LRF_L2 TaxID=3369421 RepID=UPI003F5F0A58